MATPGTVPNLAASGSGARRCPLCACELALSAERSSCPQLRVRRRPSRRRTPPTGSSCRSTSSRQAARSARPLARRRDDPAERADRSRSLANWLRRHPRATAIAGAAALATVVLPIGSLVAYRPFERGGANRDGRTGCGGTAAAGNRRCRGPETSDELKSRDARLEQELRDRQALEKSLANNSIRNLPRANSNGWPRKRGFRTSCGRRGWRWRRISRGRPRN